MTSKQIQALNGFERSEKDWLKEIAYQLALLNERYSVEIVQEAPKIEIVAPRVRKPRSDRGKSRKKVA